LSTTSWPFGGEQALVAPRISGADPRAIARRASICLLCKRKAHMTREEQSAVPVKVKRTDAVSVPHTRHDRLLHNKHLREMFHHEMDRVLERMWGDLMMPFHRMLERERAWHSERAFPFAEPAIDLTEDDQAYTITAEVPGLEQKDIEVSLSGDMLTPKGEKRGETEDKEKDLYVSERAYGSFQRSFELPDGVDREKIAADLSKGVLTITLLKTAEAQKSQKKIEVKAAA
jgi:HSP20 family protein